MRPWLFSLPIIFLLSACGSKSAFEYFTKLDSRQERAVTNLRRMTIKENNATVALLNIIYLNPVEPGAYGDNPAFLIGLYDRRGKGMEAYRTTLNGRLPAGMVELDDNCTLRTLMPLNNPWNRYYQALFKADGEANLTLRFETDPSLQGEVTYRTDE